MQVGLRQTSGPVLERSGDLAALLPDPPPARRLEEGRTADWLVIGAGFAGLAAAKRLSQLRPEDSVVLLEALRVAEGPAGRNSGFMIDLPHHLQSSDYSGDHDQREIRQNRFAIDYAKSLVGEFELGGFTSGVGRINAATDAAGTRALAAYARHLDTLDEPYTRLDAEALKEITGTDYYRDGIHMPGCLLIQPAGYIRGVAAGLSERVHLFENSPVTEIRTGSSNQVRTPAGSVEAKKVILTVNGHLESFGFSRGRLMHLFLYGSMTRELTAAELQQLGGRQEWGITPAHAMGSTLRRLRENRIVVRNHITYNPALEHGDGQMQRALERHRESFDRRFPMLAGAEMEYQWSGALCLSLNSVPVFGEIEKGVYAACCQNGLGATKGTLHGVLIADHAMGDNHDMVREILDLDDPKRLYPEPFMGLGARTRLWWGQRQAGLDL